MNPREQFLVDFRSETIGEISAETSIEAVFQNQTLRPILKLQNDLSIIIFKNYIIQSKADFANFKIEKKLQFIENNIQKDNNLKNIYKGIIVALFTTEEFKQYANNASSINKRMISMLIERLKSQVQLFENLAF